MGPGRDGGAAPGRAPHSAAPQGRSPLPEVLSSRMVYSGAVVSLRVDEVRAGTGSVTREVVEHSGAVVMVALDDEGRVVLARQFRHAVSMDLLEFPAGGLESGEDPLEAARRELREEAGLVADEWVFLGSFFSSPGFLHEELHAFLARGLTPAEQDLDEDEDIETVWVGLDDLMRGAPALSDAKTLATLLLLQRHLESERLQSERDLEA